MSYFSQLKLMNALSIKDVISVKIRPRCDSWTDQWNRLLMSKILLITSIIIGIDYFQDEIICVLPETTAVDDYFVSSACWISGFYIYPELRDRWKHAGYYGVPKDLNLNGIDEHGDLCSTKTKYGKPDSNCVELSKEFYLQYQWYPFFISALAVSFYLPYVVFRLANSDLIELRRALTLDKQDKERFVASYFNSSLNSKNEMRIRLLITIAVKLIYIGVNVGSFYIIDLTFNGRFMKYGTEWIKWSQLSNETAHDIRSRGYPKPGNELLPSMGICEVNEASRDARSTFLNRHKFVCEMSQNVLYQHCLLVIWFLLLTGALISLVGLILEIYTYLSALVAIYHKGKKKYACTSMTIREYQYFKLMKKYADLQLYMTIVNGFTRNNCENIEELRISKL